MKRQLSDPDLQNWQINETYEVFKKVIIKWWNPFLAMEVFKYVPSVLKILKSDSTPEGKALWKHYFQKYFMVELNLTERFYKKMSEMKNVLSKEAYFEYTMIYQFVKNRNYGHDKGYRKMFLRYWKFYSKFLNLKLADLNGRFKELPDQNESIENKMFYFGHSKLRYVHKEIIFQESPLHSELLFNGINAGRDIISRSNHILIHNIVKSKKYQDIFLIDKDVFELIVFEIICCLFINTNIEKILEISEKAKEEQMFMLDYRLKCYHFEIFLINNGGTNIYKYIENICDKIISDPPESLILP